MEVVEQSKYRKALNKTLLRYVKRAKPLFDRYQKECSGPMNEYVKETEQKLMKEIADAKAEAADEAAQAYDAYMDRLDKKAKSISGKNVDQADLALLESSLYTLNQEEFDVLQDRYEGNRSMERILAGYAEKRGQGNDMNNRLSCRFLSDKQKRDLAHQQYKECRSWIANDGGWGIHLYVEEMAGEMFAPADKLKE